MSHQNFLTRALFHIDLCMRVIKLQRITQLLNHAIFLKPSRELIIIMSKEIFVI